MFPTREHIEAAQYAASYWKAKAGVYVWPSVTLAQALIESAGWTKLAGKNNGFGIKATQAQIDAGHATSVWTKEEVNGSRVSVQAWFADFDSLRDAYIEHGRILATVKAYREAWSATNARDFVAGIGRYATASNYRVSVLAVMDRLKLEQYDEPQTVSEAAPKPTHPAIIPGASGAAGGAVIVAASHSSLPSFGMVAAFLIVAAIVGVAVLLTLRKKTDAALVQVAAKPAPEVVKLLDEIAPLPPSPAIATTPSAVAA